MDRSCVWFMCMGGEYGVSVIMIGLVQKIVFSHASEIIGEKPLWMMDYLTGINLEEDLLALWRLSSKVRLM